MKDIKYVVRSFLHNRGQRQLRLHTNSKNVILMKIRFDGETDFIYMRSSYGWEDLFGAFPYANDRFEYAGIYSIIRDRVIYPSYDFRKYFDEEESESEDFRKEVASAVSQRVVELVDNKPVPVTEEACLFDSRMESHIDYYSREGAHEEALRWYYYEGLPHYYVPIVDPDEWLDTRYLVMALNHRERCIEELANLFIRRNANKINLRLEELKLVQAEYDKLLTQKGEHFYMKRIAKAVENKDIKTVQLNILKDGKPFSTKYDAGPLRSTSLCHFFYPKHYMSKESRSKFERLYGAISSITPSEITRIIYGRKIIYDKEKLEGEG